MANDLEMLEALTDPDVFGKLREVEQRAFTDMLEKLRSGEYTSLTPPQRNWVTRCYKERGFEDEEGALNLHSAGIVPQGIPMPKRHYEKMDRPVLPPHRMIKK